MTTHAHRAHDRHEPEGVGMAAVVVNVTAVQDPDGGIATIADATTGRVIWQGVVVPADEESGR